MKVKNPKYFFSLFFFICCCFRSKSKTIFFCCMRLRIDKRRRFVSIFRFCFFPLLFVCRSYKWNFNIHEMQYLLNRWRQWRRNQNTFHRNRYLYYYFSFSFFLHNATQSQVSQSIERTVNAIMGLVSRWVKTIEKEMVIYFSFDRKQSLTSNQIINRKENVCVREIEKTKKYITHIYSIMKMEILMHSWIVVFFECECSNPIPVHLIVPFYYISRSHAVFCVFLFL